MTGPAPGPLDGRTARRERNRAMALAAVHELFVETYRLPTIEDVAERSGVSLRSLYRYFDDARQMHLEALARSAAVVAPSFELPRVGEGSLADRVRRYVDHRLAIYDDAGPTLRATLSVAADLPVLGERVRNRKEWMRAQTRRHFAPEIEALPVSEADDLVDAIELLGQFESLERLRRERGLSRARSRRVLTRAVDALLFHAGD